MLSALVLIVIVLVGKKKEIRKNLDFLQSFPLRQRKRVIALTLSGGVLLIVNWLLFIFVVNSINIKTASFSYMICPVITAVLGFLILQERLTILQWSAVGLCAISCLLIGINSAAELFYSFLTAFVYALYLVSQRKNQGFDRIIILAIQVTFAAFILLFFYSSLISELPATTKFYETMFLIATIFTVLPLFLNLYALNRINAATIGILLYLNPIFNFTVALLIFNEVVNLIQIVGYFIIVIALVIFNYPTIRKYQLSIEKRTN
jgi:chloramphenicol-sensitive protein RarD